MADESLKAPHAVQLQGPQICEGYPQATSDCPRTTALAVSDLRGLCCKNSAVDAAIGTVELDLGSPGLRQDACCQ